MNKLVALWALLLSIVLGQEVEVKYRQYYYPSLSHKMEESRSFNKCKVQTESKGKQESTDYTVKVIRPSDQITKKWGNTSSIRVFYQTSRHLCQSKQFGEVKHGRYRLPKGCAVYRKKRNGPGLQSEPSFFAATLHPYHARCDYLQSASACTAGENGPTVQSTELRSLHEYPFLIKAKNVIVGKSGMLVKSCGVFGLLSSCEAVNWGVVSALPLLKNVSVCLDSSHGSSQRTQHESCPLKSHDKVFVMTQYDDTQIGQFMLESLPKLMFHLEFLWANPDIKIHYGFSKRAELPNFVLPHIMLHWLGFGDRLINGSIVANQIWLPREGGCQDTSYAAWETVTQRETLLALANAVKLTNNKNNLTPDVALLRLAMASFSETKDRGSRSSVRKIVVIKRGAGKFIQNQGDRKARRWPPDVFVSLLSALRTLYPNHEVVVFADTDESLMLCPPCQVRLFSSADLVIGMHGAGLTNTLFMKPGSVVVEVIPEFDSRHAPAIGIFPRLSALVGLHHYSYYTKDTVLDGVKLANDAQKFFSQVTNWA